LDTIVRPARCSARQLKNSVPARERVYERLKGAILSGRLNPEERLTEEHLAEKMGVSRTPIREALHKLASEGLIKALETRGFIVPPDSREEVEELFDIRAVLEGHALRVICEKISGGDLKKLSECVERAEHALERNRVNDVFKWNTQFHDTLHGMVTDRERLHRMMVEMRQYVLRYRKDTLQHPEAGKRTLDGHRKILLALGLKDPDLCERMMREHIQQAREDALRTLFGKRLGEEV
jgi:DNA-binding GntR family transcriptional regulator